MHFEILVEGACEKTALFILMERIVGPYERPHTWKIHEHRGVTDLLRSLPARLQAYARSRNADDVVVVLLDLDDREDCRAFKQSLTGLLPEVSSKPWCLFRLAIEELEAWYFGDRNAIVQAYPTADPAVLDGYVQDSRCGTWEKLAEAIHPGGLDALKAYGKRSTRVLAQKKVWSKTIAPYMDVEQNRSPSFQCFRDGLRRMTAMTITDH